MIFMDFSIIILNFNTRKITDNCLQAIFKNCNPNNTEVILVDNGSTDNSAEFFRKKYVNKINLIINERNYGFGRGNNKGARFARGKILFFLNSDTLIVNNIFKRVYKIFNTYPEVAVLAPRLLLADGGLQPYVCGSFPDIADLIANKIKKERRPNNSLFFCDWVSGAAMFVRNNVFWEAGGFDEDYFMYFEDIDLCKKLKNNNYQIALEPRIKVTHLVASSSTDNENLKKMYFDSQDLFFSKHYGFGRLFLLKICRQLYKMYLRCKHELLRYL